MATPVGFLDTHTYAYGPDSLQLNESEQRLGFNQTPVTEIHWTLEAPVFVA